MQRRSRKEPIAYIIEKKEFWSKMFFVTSDTLIPRPETELIVEQLVKKFKNKRCSIKIQGNGEETRSFCYVDDAIEQILQISLRGKNREIYNVGQNYEISIKKLIKDISNILKIKILVKNGKLQDGSVKRRCPDMTKTFRLKKINKNNYLNGLKKTTLWYKEFFLNEK